jgi:tetratricopeptide (TPR) repeat protein
LFILSLPVAHAQPPDSVEDARRLISQGKVQEGTVLLEQWVAAHPDDIESVVLLLDLYGLNQPSLASALIRRTLRLTGDRADLLERLVQVQEQLGKGEPLLDAVQRLREFRKDDPLLLLQLAKAQDIVDNPSESAAALDAYLALRPDDITVWARLAERRERLEHVVDAIRAREALRILKPQDTANRRALGELYIRLGRDVEALAAYEAVRDINPADVQALKRLAQLYGWNGMPKQRIKTLQTVRTLAPTDVDVRRALAEAYSDIERYDLAAVELDAVVMQQPEDLPSRIMASRYHSWANNDDSAIAHLEIVLQKNPANALARRLLADLLRSRGDRLEALYHYQQLYDEGQADREAKEAIQELELETLSRVSGEYEFYIDRNGQLSHEATTWFERSPSEMWRYRTGYRFTYNQGVSLQRTDEEFELPGHGGFIGSRFRLAPRSYLDAELWVAVIEEVDPFVGFRVGWTQRAQFPMEFRLYLNRRQDMSTIDALYYDTVVYELNAELQVEPVDLWLLEADLGYGRWINDSIRDGTRQFNNGFTWRVGTGVRILEEPLTLEVMVDYDGIAFQVFAASLPYFAPETYQRLGGTVYLNHKPTWRFEYSLFARPNWVIEDNAMQVVYGGDMKLFVARRHWIELSFVRTDTAVGTTNVVYRENVARFTWISAF